MNVYKFLIGPEKYVHDPVDGTLEWKGCLAVAYAEDEIQARAQVQRYADENGLDARWLRAARVLEIKLSGPATLAFVML